MSKLAHSNEETMEQIGTNNLKASGYSEREIEEMRITERPWKIDYHYSYDENGDRYATTIINNSNGAYVSTTGHKDSKEARADAAHIVKCVNLHDELISIVQELASLSIAPHDGFNTPTAKINELVVGSRIVLGKAGLKKKEATNA